MGHITEHLTQTGVLEPKRLYESPFSDLAPGGPEDLWTDDDIDRLIVVLKEIKGRAMGDEISA